MAEATPEGDISGREAYKLAADVRYTECCHFASMNLTVLRGAVANGLYSATTREEGSKGQGGDIAPRAQQRLIRNRCRLES